jgi:hypothetical protein
MFEATTTAAMARMPGRRRVISEFRFDKVAETWSGGGPGRAAG